MEYPRGEVLISPVAVSYVALGDSYSSGEGILPFENGTNSSGLNECHRSHYAYARLLDRNSASKLSLTMGGFHACAGAETKHIRNESRFNEEVQWNRLTSATKVVSLTIGGNDIGFVAFGTACVVDVCHFDSAAYATALHKIENVLPASLEGTYRKILEKAPNAKIYVLGYPQIAPIKTAVDPVDLRCGYLYLSGYDPTGTIPRNWEDAQAAHDIVTRLNTKISQIVYNVRLMGSNNLRLQYVEVNGTSSPFAGHTVCSAPGESYFNNIDQWVGHPGYALHPNEKGQQAYANLLLNEIRVGNS